MQALPALLCSDEAARRWAGCNAGQRREGLCRRGHPKRQGDKPPGPLGPDTWAHTIVPWALATLEALLHGGVQDLATAGGGARQGTGLLEGTDLEPTARYEGGGQGTRQRTSTDQRGQVRTRAVTVYGWKLRVRLEAMPQSPLAAQVVQLQDQAATVPRPLVTRRAPSWPTLPAGSGSSWTAGFWTGLPGGGWPRRACALWSQRQRTGA